MNEAEMTIRAVSRRYIRRQHCFTGGRIASLPSMNRWMSSSSSSGSGDTIINNTAKRPIQSTERGEGIKTALIVERRQQSSLLFVKYYGKIRSFGSKGGEGEMEVVKRSEDVKQAAAAPGWFATRFIKEHDPYKRELEWTFHAWHWGLLGLHLLVVWWFVHKNYENHLKDFYNPLGSDGSKNLSMARLKFLEQQRRKLKAFTSVEDDPDASPKEMQRRKIEAFKYVEKAEDDRLAQQHTDEVTAMTGNQAVTPEEKLAATMKWRKNVAERLKESAESARKTVAVATIMGGSGGTEAVTVEQKQTAAAMDEEDKRKNEEKSETELANSKSGQHLSETVIEQKDEEQGKEMVKAEKNDESIAAKVMEVEKAGPVSSDLISLQKKIESLEAKLDSVVARQGTPVDQQ